MNTTKKVKYRSLWVAVCLAFSFGQLYAQSECATELQGNGAVYNADNTIDLTHSDKSRLWECPSLQNVKMDANGTYPYTHKLQDIDFGSGIYKCAYYYKDSGQYKQSCKYKSALYKGMVDKAKGKINGRVKPDGTAVAGIKSSDNDIDLNEFNYVGVVYPPEVINAQKEFNKIRSEIIDISKGDIHYSALNRNPRSVKKKIQNKKIADFGDINRDIIKLQKLTQAHLIDPYLHPGASSVRKGHTLSNFVAGVITLDPNVVTGYDPNSGEILIRSEWKRRAASIKVENTRGEAELGIWDSIVAFVTGIFGSSTDTDIAKKERVAQSLYDGDFHFEVYSYAKLFEDKLWGFYYLLQERFDMGYNALATNLLFLMTVWFIGTIGIREVVKYHADKDNYKAELTGDGYIKVLIIAATLAMFYLSMPSGINDKPDNSGTMESNQMTKNYTLAKKFIRKTAQLGMDTATMFSDLGLSAFIQYVVKKEMMLSVDEIKRELERSIEDIYMLPPALQLREECKKYYNNPSDAEFFKSIDDLEFPINEKWKEKNYAKNKNISGIDYNVCMKAYKIYALAPYQIGLAVGTAQQELQHADTKLSEATYLMSYNNVALNEKMGWIAGFGIPLEYFILKHNDMFLSEEINADEVKETAEKITGALVKDGNDLKRRSLGGAIQDKSSYGVARIIDLANSLYVHNILPAFSDIQKSIYQYAENVYESKLRIRLAGVSDGKEQGKIGEMISTFKKYAGKIYGLGKIGAVLSAATPDITSSFLWHSLILLGSYAMAIYIWKLTFYIVFTVAISMIFLISFILYFFDLLVHFTTSLFMFVWGFTQIKTGQGEGKIKEWLKNTILVVFLKPTVLVFGLFMFIFLYELMMRLYHYVFTSVTTNLMAGVSLMSSANSKTGVFDSINAYSTVMAMQTIAEVVVDLFGLYLAYLALLKIPSIVFKKTGVDSEDVSHGQSHSETLSQKMENKTGPMG